MRRSTPIKIIKLEAGGYRCTGDKFCGFEKYKAEALVAALRGRGFKAQIVPQLGYLWVYTTATSDQE